MDIDLGKEFEKITAEYEREISNNFEQGLDKASEVLSERLSESSPKKTKKYRKSWRVKKYPRCRYVGNTTTVEGKDSDNIPLSNILEAGTDNMPARPHIRKTFDAIQDELAEIIFNEIGGK